MSEDKLGFVFELVRHGARGALLDDPGAFQVDTGMLTQVGMRQRHMLGRMNRQRYMEQAGLLDSDYLPSQMHIQSTDVFRTLQSAYSELLGLYPPESNNFQQLSAGEMMSLQSGKGMPPMKVRMAKEINSYMSDKALIDGYTQIPVFAYEEVTLKDDIAYSSCQYVQETWQFLYWDNHTFDSISEPFFELLRDPLAEIFNLTESQRIYMSFPELYQYCDALVSENQEGDPPKYNFTEEQWFYVTYAQKFSLTMRFTDYARQIMDTKLMRYPLQLIQQKVDNILNGTERKLNLKYQIYSAHDDQVANLLVFLNPKFDWHNVPTCSQIFFELHYDDVCLAESTDSSCFWVEVTYNGEAMYFDPCIEANVSKGDDTQKNCYYDDFVSYMKSISVQGDLVELCNQTYVPPTN